MKKQNYSTWAQIDLKAIAHNLKEIRRVAKRNKFRLPTRSKTRLLAPTPMDILPVIKADAYGHGMVKIAKLLAKCGINFFAVSDVQEGIALREAGVKKQILLFESTLTSDAKQIFDYKLTPTVCTYALAKQLNILGRRHKRKVNIHIKIDTGMGRLGVLHSQAFKFVQKIMKLDFIVVQGIYTHFPVADTDRKFTQKQIDLFYDLITQLDRKGLIIPYIHAANSMGLAGYKTHMFNLARPGLMLYGLYPSANLKRRLRLKPAMNIKSRVIFTKKVEKGQGISYGRTFVAKKPTQVATIPIGYNDGYLRQFSNKAQVIIKGQKCPILGNVTMDQIMTDVTGIKGLKEGQEVLILGKKGKTEVSADELAKHAHTINYEVICGLGNRLPKVYI